ncbi:hypothetical protein CHARACLAT_001938 [Characodon lateralis]|uniref:Uncharacterized protein n=1 Tax=Characodon lateralis TaxID=208331 RepID=A0ABU7F203_9TELE|nr:hypothetical protein [Characodon lateralis]
MVAPRTECGGSGVGSGETTATTQLLDPGVCPPSLGGLELSLCSLSGRFGETVMSRLYQSMSSSPMRWSRRTCPQVTLVMLLIDKKKKHFEEEEVVKKLCSVNGLSYEKIASEGSSIRSLEIFFSGFPRMVGLSYFPNLCQLTIVDQNINQIEGLDGCPMLQELWIVQCHLTVSGL